MQVNMKKMRVIMIFINKVNDFRNYYIQNKHNHQICFKFDLLIKINKNYSFLFLSLFSIKIYHPQSTLKSCSKYQNLSQAKNIDLKPVL